MSSKRWPLRATYAAVLSTVVCCSLSQGGSATGGAGGDTAVAPYASGAAGGAAGDTPVCCMYPGGAGGAACDTPV